MNGMEQHRAALGEAHDMAADHYDKAGQEEKLLDAMGGQLEKLAKLGDQIEMSDMVEAAGNLIASGMDTPSTTQWIGSAPAPNGQALAGWVEQQRQGLEQVRQQFAVQHSLVRHRMGLHALAHLQALSGEGGADPAAGAPSPSPLGAAPSAPSAPANSGAP
jgi:hypothetical protein